MILWEKNNIDWIEVFVDAEKTVIPAPHVQYRKKGSLFVL